MSNYTIDDVIAKMLRHADTHKTCASGAVCREFAEMLKEAWKRESEKLNSIIQAQRSEFYAEQDRQRREHHGNAAKLREALELFAHMNDDGYYDNSPVIKNIVEKAKCALAAPPRQCDVGTARQQEKRHKEEACLKSACPKHEGFVSKACKGCFAMWAQMPYEERGAE